MKTKKILSKLNVPDVWVVIGYDGIYDDYKTVKVHELLKDIPTLSLLHYITQQINKIVYSFGNQNLQRSMLYETCKYLPKEVRKKIRHFIGKP